MSDETRPLATLREATLVAVTFAAVAGFRRLFIDWSFVPALAGAAAATHLLCHLCRRRRWSVPSAAALVAAAAFVGIALAGYRDTLTIAIPSRATVAAMGDDLRAAWDLFQEVVAPTVVDRGFLLVSVIAVVLAVFLADWAAFRLDAPFEAIVPASALFVFGALLGSTEFRLPSAALAVGSVLAYVLVHRVIREQEGAGWLTADADRGTRALLNAGLGMSAIALATGLLAGPLVPGAESDALVGWRNLDDRPGSRVTISPLVDIHARLVDQAEVELFTVRSSERAYWRLTSLDKFDGAIWKSGGKYREADGELPTDLPAGVEVQTVRQSVAVAALKALWLPAAFEPAAVDSPHAKVRYEADSATLIVDTTLANSDGVTYSVISRAPTFTAAQLEAADGVIPEALREHYTALPGDFSTTARSLAEEITADASTPYDKALALQNFFRDFTYDLDVSPGHSTSAIDSFLETRTGYCEQFSGTYAAMARSLGIPARVAVGFTPGIVDEDDPDVYHVKGEHAHAWPEVYLGGAGWVAFEPTPGRGAPRAQAYTGVPEAQDAEGPDVVATTLTTPTTTSGTTPTSVTPTTFDPADLKGLLPDVATDNGVRGQAQTSLGERVLLGLFAVLLAATFAVATVPALRSLRRRRRRRRAVAPTAQVLVAWMETQEDLALAGARRSSAETHTEFAARAHALLGLDGAQLGSLADDATAADYAWGGVDDAVAHRARTTASTVQHSLRIRQTRGRRLRNAMDPRPLWRHRRSRR